MPMSKTKSHIFVLLVFLVLAGMIVSPISAQDVTYTAPANYCVWAINFDIPDGSSGTIVMNQANGDVVTASWSRGGLPLNALDSQIGADSETFNLYPVIPAYGSIWNGENTTTSRQLKMGTGLAPLGWSRVIQTTIDPAVITSYHLTSDADISISQELKDTRSAVLALNPANEYNLVTLLTAYIPLVVGVFLSLIYWLKFLFVDHLILTVSLYLTGTMAYAINTSRNIFKFYGTWFKQQVAMFKFIAESFDVTFRILTQVAAIVGQAAGLAATIIAAIIRSIIRV